jgi:hypothetical protein
LTQLGLRPSSDTARHRRAITPREVLDAIETGTVFELLRLELGVLTTSS